MPSTATHSYFAIDVYNHLDFVTKEFMVSDKKWLKTTAQGMDPTFFYHLTKTGGKKIRDFGIYFQTHNTFLFFETLINYIKYNNYYNDSEVMGFLYGQLCHYCLDRICHPYIEYISGEYIRGKKSTYKYNQLHGENESKIDQYFIAKRENVIPWKYKLYNDVFDTRTFSKNLKDVINFTFNEVFNIKDFSTYYEKSIKEMKSFFKVFRHDSNGLKLASYYVVDFVCPRILLRKVPLSYHMNFKNINTILNLNHEEWCFPCDNSIKSTDSFMDLYTKGVQDAVYMIENINLYIYKDKNINLRKVIGNINYESGLDCDIPYKLTHFKI